MFEDELVTNADGGSRAANLLNEAIKSQLKCLKLDHCHIMVRIYANLVGLSKTLSSAQLCGPGQRSLAPFVADFNRSEKLFDFVDAGEHKENADFKIRAVLHQFVASMQCKHSSDCKYLHEDVTTSPAATPDNNVWTNKAAFHSGSFDPAASLPREVSQSCQLAAHRAIEEEDAASCDSTLTSKAGRSQT